MCVLVHGSTYNNTIKVCAPGLEALDESGRSPDWYRTSTGETSLFVAAARGHLDCVRVLLCAGADPCCANVRRESALHLAALNVRTVFLLHALQNLQYAGALGRLFASFGEWRPYRPTGRLGVICV